MGVSIQELSTELASQFGVPDLKGVLVSDVLDDSPARRAGFERGDVIVEYDGKPVENPTQLRNMVAQTVIGRKVSVKFIRDKRPRTLDITIAEQPKTVAQGGSEESGESVSPAGALADVTVGELTPDLASRFNLSSGEKGVVVVRVKPGGSAEEAGVREGDLILEVNRQAVTNLKTYEKATAKLGKDQSVLLLIKRQGRTTYLTLKP
jgi:serine protease Do